MDKVYKHKKLNPFVKDKEIIKSLLHEIHPAFIRKELQNLLKGKRVDASSDLKKFYYLLYKVVQDYQLSKKFIPEKKDSGEVIQVMMMGMMMGMRRRIIRRLI